MRLKSLVLISFVMVTVIVMLNYLMSTNERGMNTEKSTIPRNVRKSKPCRSLPINQKAIDLDSKIINGIRTMVLFIGYPRSGHSLIGSLLDAHPHMIIANEYNVLEKWTEYRPENRNKKYFFQQLYTNSHNESMKGDRSTEDCLYKTKYNYFVPNQWQGKFDKSIKVIGDKKGGKTSLLLQRSKKHLETLKTIARTVNIPIRFIHVVRNPFDVMATMILRQQFPINKDRWVLYKNPANISRTLQRRRAEYFMRMATENYKMIKTLDKRVITILSEDVISNPPGQLLRICQFLNIECSQEYLKDCSSIVYGKPSKTRGTIIWDQKAKDIILKHIEKIPFLNTYTFYN